MILPKDCTPEVKLLLGRNVQQMGLEDSVIKDHPWGAQVIHIHDPEGNRVEFWTSNKKLN